MKWLRQRMTYANVMSTLAVFIALGGSSYAAVKISGNNIKSRSISAAKIRRNSLTGREIRESRLGRVPRSANADRVGGLTATELRLHCPADTVLVANVCVEREPRAATSYGSAVLQCLRGGGPRSSGRRLPTHDELRDALTLSGIVTLAPGGELTADVSVSSADPGRLDDVVIVDAVGDVAVVPDRDPDGSRQYRCVTDPINGPS
jgi:hypothetical protein